MDHFLDNEFHRNEQDKFEMDRKRQGKQQSFLTEKEFTEAIIKQQNGPFTKILQSKKETENTLKR